MVKILHALSSWHFPPVSALSHHVFSVVPPACWIAAALVLFVLNVPEQSSFGLVSRKASALLFTVSGFFLIAVAFR